MARTLTLPSHSYQPGTYTFAVDSIAPADNEMYAMLTCEDWPVATPLMRVSVVYDNGAGAAWTINSPQFNVNRTPKTSITLSAPIPQTGTGKAAVNSATVVFEVLAPMQTTVTAGLR